MPERLERLDHLRAIASFVVVSWHLGTIWPRVPEFLSPLRQGHAGVSMFCVISGFILTTIYLPRETAYFSFLKNRLLRVAPLFLFISLLAFYVSGWDIGSFLAAVLAGLFRGGLPSFAGPGWTVLIEFQFYLLFPFLLIFTRRDGARYLVGLLLTFMLVRAAVWNAAGTVQEISYYSIFGRMDQFLIGMTAGVLLSRSSVRNVLERRHIALAVLAIGVATAFVFFWWFDAKGGLLHYNGGNWPNKSAIWVAMPSIEGIIFVAVMIGYLYMPKMPGFGWLSKTAAYIGLISYSIYLDHVLAIHSIFIPLKKLGFAPTSEWQSLFGCLFVVMPTLIAIASMTYYFIERPFMRLRVGRYMQSRVNNPEPNFDLRRVG